MTRLPVPGQDQGSWGAILNDYLSQCLNADGQLKPNTVTSSALATDAVTSAALGSGVVQSTNLGTTNSPATNQVLSYDGSGLTWVNIASAPVTSVAGKTGAVTLVKADVGLGNVDNTSDTSKPVSTATQTALNLKAPLANPTFTGVVTVPTPSNTTDATTKAYVDSQVSGATTPDATSSTKGKLRLTGDLAGTADAPTVPGLADKLAIASNLSDLNSATTARTNLGLGNAATQTLTQLDTRYRAVGAKATRTNSMIFNNGQSTFLSFEAAAYDPAGFWAATPNPGRLTMPSGHTDSLVSIKAFVPVAANGTGVRTCGIRKNGTGLLEVAGVGNASATFTFNLCTDVLASTGDYFDIYVYHNAGSGLNGGGGAFMSVTVYKTQ